MKFCTLAILVGFANFFACFAADAQIECGVSEKHHLAIELMASLENETLREQTMSGFLADDGAYSQAERLAILAYMADYLSRSQESFSTIHRWFGAELAKAAAEGFVGRASIFKQFMCDGFEEDDRLGPAYDAWAEDSAAGDRRAVSLLKPLDEAGLIQASYLLANIYIKTLSHRETYYFQRKFAPEGLQKLIKVWQGKHDIGENLLRIFYPYHLYNHCLTEEQRDTLNRGQQRIDALDVASYRELALQQNPECEADFNIYEEASLQYSLTSTSYPECSFEESSNRQRLCRILRGAEANVMSYEGQTYPICKLARDSFIEAAKQGDEQSISALVELTTTGPSYSDLWKTGETLSDCYRKDDEELIDVLEIAVNNDTQEYSYLIGYAGFTAHRNPARSAKLLYDAALLAREADDSEALFLITNIFLDHDNLQNTVFFERVQNLIE